MSLADYQRVRQEVDAALRKFNGLKLVPDDYPYSPHYVRVSEIKAAVKTALARVFSDILFVVTLDEDDPTKVDVFGARYDKLKILEREDKR